MFLFLYDRFIQRLCIYSICTFTKMPPKRSDVRRVCGQVRVGHLRVHLALHHHHLHEPESIDIWEVRTTTMKILTLMSIIIYFIVQRIKAVWIRTFCRRCSHFSSSRSVCWPRGSPIAASTASSCVACTRSGVGAVAGKSRWHRKRFLWWWPRLRKAHNRLPFRSTSVRVWAQYTAG